MDEPLDLDAYLRRVNYSGDRSPSYAVLQALHLAHATHIPFENLDILLGRPIRLDLVSIQEKLVRSGRGGYCFEHNLLFATVLEQLGFSVVRLAARVRYRTELTLPRTHMLLAVGLGRSRWLADVGFGAEGLLGPVALGPEEPSRQFLWTYRVARSRGLTPPIRLGSDAAAVPDAAADSWVLQSLRDGAWCDLYRFSLEPQEHADYVMANHFTSTHPSSRFVQTLTAQVTSPTARTTLRNLELTVDRGVTTETRTLAGEPELLEVLAETFGLRFPAGTRFGVTL